MSCEAIQEDLNERQRSVGTGAGKRGRSERTAGSERTPCDEAARGMGVVASPRYSEDLRCGGKTREKGISICFLDLRNKFRFLSNVGDKPRRSTSCGRPKTTFTYIYIRIYVYFSSFTKYQEYYVNF